MRLILSLLCCVLLSSPALADKPVYFSALPDLPVAPRLEEMPHGTVRFDQPEGRIIVLQAAGPAETSDIMSFYAKTLPALGWTLKAPGQYTRGREVLLLDIRQVQSRDGEGDNRLNILLRPL